MAQQRIGAVEFNVEVDARNAISNLDDMKAAVSGLTAPLTGLDQNSSRALGNINRGTKAASVSFGKLSKNAGQAGIQVQQFVGQIQGGQSVMLAFSQQAADLGIVLGAPLLGAVTGLAASFAGILLPTLFDTGEEFQDLISSTDSLIGKFQELNESSQAFVIDKLERDIKSTKETIKDLKGELGLAKNAYDGAVMSGKRYKDEQEEAKKEVEKLEDALQSQIIKLEEQKAALQELQHIQETGASTKEIEEEDKAEADLERRRKERNKRRLEREEELHRRLLQIRQDAFSKELDQLTSKFVTEEELEQQDLQRKLDMSQAFYNAELDALFKNIDESMRAQEKQRKEQERLDRIAAKAKINAASSVFSNLSQLMNTESKRLFEIGKAAAVAGAIVDGYSAVAKTMASVPYPFNIPLAIAQGAASLAQVNGILNTKLGDKGPGQSFTGGQLGNVQSQPTGPQQPDRIVNIQGLNANELVSGRQVIDLINEAQADGARITIGG